MVTAITQIDEVRTAPVGTGIAPVGSVPWGTHFCHLYQTREDILEVLVPYFKTGLSENNLCVWITCSPLSVPEAEAALARAIPDLPSYLRTGQMQVLDYEAWYLKDASFDMNRVLDAWKRKLSEAVAHGYSGMRNAGNMSWITRDMWANHVEYESIINRYLGKGKFVGICSYDLASCGPSELADVISNHQFAVVKRAGAWTTVENGIYRQTEEKMQREAEIAQRDWQRTFDSMTDALAILDLNHNIVRVNKTMGQLLDTVPEQLVGKKCFKVMHGLDGPLDRCPKPKCLDSLSSNEMEYQEPRLNNHWLRVRVDPIFSADGELVGVLHNVRDITEKKAVDQLKEEFLNMVSHEMKTPLTVLVGALHTVLSGEDALTADERKGLTKDAYVEAQSLTDLVNNLLELSRSQADRLVLNKGTVDANRVLRKVVVAARSQHPKHKFSVGLPGRSLRIPADPIRLERVLFNLVDNAAKYSPEGSVVRIFGELRDRELVLGVADEGEGISAEDQAKLFSHFERLGREQSGRTGGTGLGLVVCQRLVEAHGGKIWLDSEPGKGSTFYVSFPRA